MGRHHLWGVYQKLGRLTISVPEWTHRQFQRQITTKCGRKDARVGTRSLFSVFACGKCGNRFRGIHAKPNRVWHQIVALLTPSSERLTETFCIHCGGDIEGSSNWCPSICRHCGRELPTDRPSQNSADVSQQSGETVKGEARPLVPPPNPADDFDGCGACTSCGFIFRMTFNNAVCPKCFLKMSKEDAFFACGSYPDSYPPENQP